MDCINNENSKMQIELNKKFIIDEANNNICISLYRRGGGVIDCNSRIIESILIVDIDINVCESMGANMVNTVCEGLAGIIEGITGGRVCTKILTNLCLKRKAVAEFCVPVNKLATKTLTVKTIILNQLYINRANKLLKRS